MSETVVGLKNSLDDSTQHCAREGRRVSSEDVSGSFREATDEEIETGLKV